MTLLVRFPKIKSITNWGNTAYGFSNHALCVMLQFLPLVLGMKSATSDFAYIWCMIHKKDRFKIIIMILTIVVIIIIIIIIIIIMIMIIIALFHLV